MFTMNVAFVCYMNPATSGLNPSGAVFPKIRKTNFSDIWHGAQYIIDCFLKSKHYCDVLLFKDLVWILHDCRNCLCWRLGPSIINRIQMWLHHEGSDLIYRLISVDSEFNGIIGTLWETFRIGARLEEEGHWGIPWKDGPCSVPFLSVCFLSGN